MANSILYRKLLNNVGESYRYSDDIPFTQPLHHHEECELIIFTGGSGKEYIGDAVVDYKPGDITLIGSNIPHLHLCNSLLCRSQEKSSCDILQFPLTLFPANMEVIQEFFDINILLNESLYGVRFDLGNSIKLLRRILNRIKSEQGIKRIILLYEVLGMLSLSKNRKKISSLNNFNSTILKCAINDPIDKTYSYLRSNFKRNVFLNEIAEYIGLNPTSLCRLFKQKTGKTIFTVLNEIRIEYACKLLTHSNLTNAEIAYEIGYNNLSYFNKVFKFIVGETPMGYKKCLK